MSIASIRFDINPQVRRALGELGVLLDDYHYSQHAKERVLAYVAREGTPTGCAYLDREDEADCEWVFVNELPAVPYDSPAWDRDAALYSPAYAEPMTDEFPAVVLDPHAAAGLVEPAEGPDAPDCEPSWSAHYAELLATGRTLPLPIRGGAPEYEPYEPTQADLEDLARWSEQLERERDIDEQREWWVAHPLGSFNRERTDA